MVEQPSTEQNKSRTKQSRCRGKKAEQGRTKTEDYGAREDSRAEQRERGRETTAELRRTKQCAADHSEANT